MITNRRQGLVIVTVLALSIPWHLQAKDFAADPSQTTKALSLLLAEANTPIPESSSCQGNFGNTGRSTVKDLLAMSLAYLYSGKNVINGHCLSKRCTVSITHAAGEDVSSTTISFALRRNKASISSLQCVITP
jgi:hypothetical protein